MFMRGTVKQDASLYVARGKKRTYILRILNMIPGAYELMFFPQVCVMPRSFRRTFIQVGQGLGLS